MTCVVVNDASCLIDLRKGGLLAVLCKLPYRFVVPLPIREAEVRDFPSRIGNSSTALGWLPTT